MTAGSGYTSDIMTEFCSLPLVMHTVASYDGSALPMSLSPATTSYPVKTSFNTRLSGHFPASHYFGPSVSYDSPHSKVAFHLFKSKF